MDPISRIACQSLAGLIAGTKGINGGYSLDEWVNEDSADCLTGQAQARRKPEQIERVFHHLSSFLKLSPMN